MPPESLPKEEKKTPYELHKLASLSTVKFKAKKPATHATITVTGPRTLRELCDTFMPPEIELLDADDSEDEDYTPEDVDNDGDEDKDSGEENKDKKKVDGTGKAKKTKAKAETEATKETKVRKRRVTSDLNDEYKRFRTGRKLVRHNKHENT